MSAIQVFLLYINHSEFSWYIKQCPLLGEGPLLGASVNGELTIYITTRGLEMSIIHLCIFYALTMWSPLIPPPPPPQLDTSINSLINH